MNRDILARSKKILKKISESDKFLIVSDAGRVDWDCLTSGLAVRRFLEKLGKKEIKNYIFTRISEDFNNIPDINLIESKYINDVDFNYYDLIILVDGSEWNRIFTQNYQKVLDQVSTNKFINIDHHPVILLENDLPDTSIRVIDSSTTKVVYDYLIKPSNIGLDKQLAEYLYYGLIDDTQCFNVLMNPDTFKFAQELIDAGVDHYKVVEEFYSLPKEAIDIMCIATNMTKYYPEIKTTILIIDEELAKRFDEISKDWIGRDLIEYYKRIIMRRPKGYDYSLIFKIDREKGTIKANWRSRNKGDILWIIKVLEEIGFQGGGHRGAGSARTLDNKMSLAEVEQKFVEAMRLVISY